MLLSLDPHAAEDLRRIVSSWEIAGVKTHSAASSALQMLPFFLREVHLLSFVSVQGLKAPFCNMVSFSFNDTTGLGPLTDSGSYFAVRSPHIAVSFITSTRQFNPTLNTPRKLGLLSRSVAVAIHLLASQVPRIPCHSSATPRETTYQG